ncbi:MAG: non-ribosomal peptide synthetase, partial [Tumebacillaceae bacterium]
YFETLMQGVLADLEQPLGQVALVEEAERARVLALGSGETVDFPVTCLHERFEAHVERTPDAEAVVFANGKLAESLTYAELNRRANRVAPHLQEQGIGAEKTVVVRMERSLEMVVAVLGVLKAGGVYVPIDPAYPMERVAFILEDTQAEVVLTQQHLMYSVPRSGAKVMCVDADWARIAEQSAENLSGVVTAENAAYVIYTSGSTGTPKGVVVEHRNVSNLLDAQKETFGITAGSRVLQFASQSFDPSVFELFAALTSGATLVVAAKETLQPGPKLTAFMREQGITFATLTPAVLALLASEELPALRTVGCGGESCPLELAQQWAVGRTFLNIYGPTEATVMATWNPSLEGSVSAHIGRPIANVQAYVLDESGQPVPAGLPGELYLGGAGLARGYLNRPELTTERFVAHPFAEGARLYKTGDRARFLADGNIEFLGRVDEQVKLRGMRIELGEVEHALRAHADVRDVVVIAREDATGEKQLVTYVVAQEGAGGADEKSGNANQALPEQTTSIRANDLRTFLQAKLPEFMVPAHFVMLDALPLTANGKVDRRALPVPHESQAGREVPYVAPRDALELQLAGMWEAVLGTGPIGVRDNFFHLGGHSLLGVRLLVQIESAFGVELPLSVLFHGGTIEQLAQVVRREENVSRSPLVPIQVGQAGAEQAPLFLVHPIGGSVTCYRELAAALGAAQPVYGLQAWGLAGGEAPFERLEEMVSYYMEAIGSVQQSGPYHLGGWSFGGVVAFEMARLLKEQGHEVTLTLIDSFAPNEAFRAEVPDDVALLQQFAADIAGSVGVDVADVEWGLDAEQVEFETVLEQLCAVAVRENILPSDLGLAYVRRLFHVFRSHLTAYKTYTPQPYAGDVTLFMAASGAQEQNAHGWTNYVRGELDVHVLTADHFSIVKAPHTIAVAERLSNRMKQMKPRMAQTH